MHSAILRQVMDTIFDWIFNFQFPWDNLTFTIWDIFEFSLIGIVFCFFLANTVGIFISRVKHYYGGEIEEHYDELIGSMDYSLRRDYWDNIDSID